MSLTVLHLIDSAGFYGAEAVLLELVLEQRRQGLNAIVCSIGLPGQPEKALERELRLRGVPCWPERMKAGFNILGALRIIKKARAAGVDLLHSHGYKSDILFGFMPRSLRRMPIITTLHGWTYTGGLSKMAVYTWLDALSLAFVDGVVAVSQGILQRKELANRRLSSICVIENGISTQLPAVEPEDGLASVLVSLRQKGPLIGSIGRLSKEKGFDVLLQAFANVRQNIKDAQLVLMGAGPCESALRDQAKVLGLESSVHFAGYVENAGKYLPLLDVYVNSSWTEGMPITLLEAMRARCLVVASRVGGIPELINDGVGGFLCEAGNVNEFANQMLRGLSSDQASSMTQHSYEHFRSRFSSEAMASRYHAFYLKHLGLAR